MSAVAPEETPGAAAGTEERTVTIRLDAVAFAAVGLVFCLIRLWPVWQMPVGGAELAHLSGAWNASIGVEDERYVPTLFQALSALLFSFTTSEVPARFVAFLATATIPLALYLLRPWLGSAGALLALVLLSFDAVGIAVSVGASAMGLDLAITAWLFVLLTRQGLPPWAWGIAAFAVATGGPIALPLVAAFLAVLLLRAERPAPTSLAWPVGGAVLGVVFATLRPGLEPEGLVVAPLALFGDGFEQRWSTADGLDLLLLASWPLVLGGLAAAGWRSREAWVAREVDRNTQVLLLWFAFAFGWLLTALPAQDPTPLAAVALPAALLLGPALTRALGAMRAGDWTYARYLIPFAAVCLAIAVFYVGDWAALDRVGDTADKLVVTGLLLGALAALGAVLLDRATLPAVLAVLLPLSAIPLVVATSVVAFGAGDSPLPSPRESPQGRELRDIALQSTASSGGAIVFHPDFADELTWPFRDSGNVVVASRIPADAGFVLWPAAAPPPEGFAPLEGEWSLVQEVEAPTGGFLRFMRWYTDRYSLTITSEPLAVYVKEGE